MLKKFGSTYIHIFNKNIENKHADFIIFIQKILIILEMSPITLEERIEIVELFYSNGESVTETQRKFCTRHGIKRKTDAPSVSTISNIIQNFKTNGCVNTSHCNGRGKDKELTQRLSSSFEEMDASGDHISVSALSKKACCSKGSAHAFLRKELKLFPYKITIGQVLSVDHKQRRLTFCTWLLNKINSDPSFLFTILWTDECSFKLSGHVNRQNIRYWGLEKPKEIYEKPIMEKKLNVFLAFNGSKIFGPFFFEDETGSTVTINGERYSNMLNDFLIPALKRHRMASRTTYQQDGAPPHVCRLAKDVISNAFGDKVISKGFTNEWPANSPDLNPLDYFMWSYLKTRVFSGGYHPTSFEELKSKINEVANEIPQNLLQSAIENIVSRLEACIANMGGHFE